MLLEVFCTAINYIRISIVPLPSHTCILQVHTFRARFLYSLPMDYLRTSPLFLFISSDLDLPQIRELLATGRSPNCQVYGGFTPFHEAICKPDENFRIVQEFIHAGADVNLSTHLGYTPLHFAVIYRKRRVVDALIQFGALVNAKTFLGHTALQFAVTKQILRIQPEEYNIRPDTWIIDKLLKHEAIDCNAVDSKGDTALMVAVKCRQSRAVSLFLQNGANPDICNNVSETPLHMAFSQPPSFTEIQLLLSGANINSVDEKGQTPLDILLKNDSRSLCNVMSVLKLIVFKYNITNNLKQKLEWDPEISLFFNTCCDEVEKMRSDFITANITVHDFVWNCIGEDQFKNILLQVHKPVVDRLVRDVYPEYFGDIVGKIPESSLYAILEMTACSTKETKYEEVIDINYLFTKTDIIPLICMYLSNVEVFSLIVAFNNVRIAETLQNLHERFSSYVVYLHWKAKKNFKST